MGIFRIQNPIVTGYVPLERRGAAGDEITVNGRFFGSKKPKVFLKYLDGSGVAKKCKVRSSSMDPATGASAALFVVPKLPPGFYAIDLANKIGEADSGYDFEVLP
jgi:hypothetical protein